MAFDPSNYSGFGTGIYSKPLDELSYNERLKRQWYERGQDPIAQANTGIKTHIGYADDKTYGANTGWLRDYFGKQGSAVPINLQSGNIEDLRREHYGLPPVQQQAPQQAPQQSSPNPFQYMGQNPFQSGTTQYDQYMANQSTAFNAPWMQTEQFQNPMAYRGDTQISPTETRQIGVGEGAYNMPFSQFMQNPNYYNMLDKSMRSQYGGNSYGYPQPPQQQPFQQPQQPPPQGNPWSGMGGGYNQVEMLGRGRPENLNGGIYNPGGGYTRPPQTNPWGGGGVYNPGGGFNPLTQTGDRGKPFIGGTYNPGGGYTRPPQPNMPWNPSWGGIQRPGGLRPKPTYNLFEQYRNQTPFGMGQLF